MAPPPADHQAPAASLRTGTLYGNAGDGLKAIRDDFHYWTAKLTDCSFELSLALIAANWAAFGSVQQIRTNGWARGSLAMVVASLAVSLLGARLMSEMHRKRAAYAAEDLARWERDCEASLGHADPWPFTASIERLGRILRALKTWLPVVAGVLFLVALFCS